MAYKLLYLALFNAITDALDCLAKQDAEGAAQILIHAQQQAEELYICK